MGDLGIGMGKVGVRQMLPGVLEWAKEWARVGPPVSQAGSAFLYSVGNLAGGLQWTKCLCYSKFLC